MSSIGIVTPQSMHFAEPLALQSGASELELLVHNEVAALERSYSDNETRMRALIDDLAGQREAIVINSERVRTSIVSAQESLSKDLRIASESIAENDGGVVSPLDEDAAKEVADADLGIHHD